MAKNGEKNIINLWFKQLEKKNSLLTFFNIIKNGLTKIHCIFAVSKQQTNTIIMNATKTNHKNTIYRLRMNKKTRIIKIDVYTKIKQNYCYLHTLICSNMNKEGFEYYYNNNMTFNDIENLCRFADGFKRDYKPYYKFKY